MRYAIAVGLLQFVVIITATAISWYRYYLNTMPLHRRMPGDAQRPDPVGHPASVAAKNPLEPTIFHESWWLDIMTGGKYQFAEVIENGRIVARLPYMLQRRHGMTIAELPQLTHFLGPAIVEGEGKENRRFLRRLDLTRMLIETLPSTSYFYIKCHAGVSDVLAFQDRGFRSSVQFSHEIRPQSIDAVWRGMRDKGRNGIRLAREHVTIDRDVRVRDFTSFYVANLRDRGASNHLDMGVVDEAVKAALARDRGALFAARDKAGNIAAIIFCVWDDKSYYYLLSTRARTAHRGVTTLLLWEAIGDAMAKGLTFDFDGICNEGSARLAANFPTTMTPRYIVTRESKVMRVVSTLKSLVREPNWFFH